MSKEKFRLHPVAAFINFVKSLKDLLFPILIIFVGNGFHFKISLNPSDELFWETVPTLILLVVLIFVLIGGIIKWWKFVYWFEDNELRVEYGLFVKKKRYIPFERIQSLNYKEGIFHRVFGLVQVRVETASHTNGKAEADLTAVTKQAAEQIESEMRKAKHLNKVQASDVEQYELHPLEQQEIHIVHKMTTKSILLHATTSGAIGVVLSGVAAVVSQFSELIPYEKVFNELAAFARIGVVLVVLVVFVLCIIAWLVSVLITVFNYYDFTVIKEQEKLIITRGLLEKKRVTIPLNRVQAIRIVENPLRQLFGYKTVILESAGGGSGEKDKKFTLFPLIKKGEEIEPLVDLFPEYHFVDGFVRSPKRARPFFYRLDFFWTVPVIAIVSYYFYPYGLLSLNILLIMILLGYWQHRTVGFSTMEKQLVLRYRVMSRVTMYMQKNRIQAMTSRQSYFQKRKQLVTVQATVMSGIAGATAYAQSIEENDAEELLKWFEERH